MVSLCAVLVRVDRAIHAHPRLPPSKPKLLHLVSDPVVLGRQLLGDWPMSQGVLESYRLALRLWVPLLSLHVFVRLVSVAVLVPFTGLLLAFVLSFSDQSAITDQDIARFLLTPVGAIGALAVGVMIVASAVVDLAAMTAVLRAGHFKPLQAVEAAFAFLISAVPKIFEFAPRFIIRILLMSLPFLVVAGVPALFFLRAYDINFYLAERPPEFLWTVRIAAVCGAVLLLFLSAKLSGWAISLHITIFGDIPARHAFDQSYERMQGYRIALIKRLVLWFAVRFVALSLVIAAAGFLLAEVPHLVSDVPRVFYVSTALLILLWLICNTLITAVSNGALAVLLNKEFEARYADKPVFDSGIIHLGGRKTLALLALIALSLGTLFLGGNASQQVGGVQEVAVIGHRGAAASRPENTMAAIIKAVEDDADWVEIDVQESADGKLIVVHDSDFMKSAGVATKVWDVTTEELAGIDIGSWFDPAYADERTPLLADVLQAVKGRSKLIIELKYYGHDVDLENRVIALVEAAGMQDDIATMSLKYPAVQKMKSLRPDWRAGVLAATSVGNLAGLTGDFLAVSAASLSGRLQAQAAVAGKDVYVWTVNDAAVMSRMISMGVDGLITDKPDLAREVIAYYQTLSTPERLMLRLADRIGFTFSVTSPDVDPV